MLWLYLYFPRLQLETQEPDNSLPLGIVDERDNRLVQLNETAKNQGVTHGMGLATAAALCPTIQLLPLKESMAQRRIEELAQGLYDLSGDISPDTPEGLWLGATRMVKYHNGFDNYCKSIRRFLERQNLTCQLGAGTSPLSARLLAKAGAPLSDQPDALARAYRQCSLALTDLPLSTREHLHRLGIQTMAGLLALPLKDLSRRFDAELAQYVGRLTGQLPHPLPFFQPPDTFRRHRELPHELETTQRLMPWVERLLAELEAFLQAREQVVKRVELRLYPREGEPTALTIGAARGESRAEHWLSLTELTLERQPLNAPVVALALSARELLPRPKDTGDCLDPHSTAKLSSDQLVALLQARLGEDRVRRLAVQEDFRPEKATVERDPLSRAERFPDSPPPPSLRPGFLLDAPQPCRQPLEIVYGPERIATGWWDQQPQVRDYYIARNKDGQWCWVFREPQQSGWFMQGYFA
ncbi:Y-family DNA polymerase [Marinimicrobium locisalis]|uniref:Y-family DNA polymerase n=1 Tax=Marinimicrobium locisalis TaxID=546022 RepID=UPI0032214CBB